MSTLSKDLSQLLWDIHKIDKHSGLPQVVHHPLSLSVIIRKDSVSRLTRHLFTSTLPIPNILELIGKDLP